MQHCQKQSKHTHILDDRISVYLLRVWHVVYVLHPWSAVTLRVVICNCLYCIGWMRPRCVCGAHSAEECGPRAGVGRTAKQSQLTNGLFECLFVYSIRSSVSEIMRRLRGKQAGPPVVVPAPEPDALPPARRWGRERHVRNNKYIHTYIYVMYI